MNTEILNYARQKATENGIDPSLVLGLFEHESGFRPEAVNPKSGATGIAQLMPKTAKEYGVKNPKNWKENINAGVTYLKDLHNRFNGDVNRILTYYGGFKKKDPTQYIASVQEKAQKYRPEDIVPSDDLPQMSDIVPESDMPKQSDIVPASKLKQPSKQRPLTKQKELNKPSKPLGDNRLLDVAVGSLETPISLATGTVAGLAGLAGSIGAGIMGKSPEEAKQVRETVQNYFTYQPKSETAKGAMDIVGKALSPLSIPRKIGEKIGDEQWGNVGDVITLATLPKAVPAGIKATKKVTGLVSEKIVPSSLKSTEKLQSNLNTVIDRGIQKGIKPYIGKKTTYGKMDKYSKQAQSAVEDIVRNKSSQVFDREGTVVSGELPKSLNELSQAVEGGMDRLMNQYTEIAKTGTKRGIKPDLTNAKQILNGLVTDEMKVARPEIVRFAKELQNRLDKYKNGNPTPLDIQNLIKELNVTGKTFYNDPMGASKGLVYETLARELRKANIDAMDKAGVEWQSFRKQYGDYLAIEKDVNRRLQVDKRTNKFGFFDLANIASAAELAKAVVKLDPASATGAIAMQLIKRRMKDLNSPNKQISMMFSNAEKLIREIDKRPKPTSTKPPYISKQIEYKPVIKMGMEDVSGKPSSYTPPLAKPTTKAIGYERSTTPINLGMLDESSVKAIKGVYNNPEFWKKNKDLTNLRIKMKNNQPAPFKEWNTLLYRITLNRMGSKINPRIPLK